MWNKPSVCITSVSGYTSDNLIDCRGKATQGKALWRLLSKMAAGPRGERAAEPGPRLARPTRGKVFQKRSSSETRAQRKEVLQQKALCFSNFSFGAERDFSLVSYVQDFLLSQASTSRVKQDTKMNLAKQLWTRNLSAEVLA